MVSLEGGREGGDGITGRLGQPLRILVVIADSTGQVANSSAAGLGLLLYHSFPALFNNHFVSKHEVFLSHLLNSSSERPENVFTAYNRDTLS